MHVIAASSNLWVEVSFAGIPTDYAAAHHPSSVCQRVRRIFRVSCLTWRIPVRIIPKARWNAWRISLCAENWSLLICPSNASGNATESYHPVQVISISPHESRSRLCQRSTQATLALQSRGTLRANLYGSQAISVCADRSGNYIGRLMRCFGPCRNSIWPSLFVTGPLFLSRLWRIDYGPLIWNSVWSNVCRHL